MTDHDLHSRALEALSVEDRRLVAEISRNMEVVALSKRLLERKEGKNDNWVESNGGLPAYIEEVAHSLHTKQGMSISKAIAVAISQIKKWAVTGEPDTKAKAAKAISQWNALKAKAAAKKAKD